MKKSGFTLTELLIAITIIAVLAAIGFVAYTSVLKSGRDSKRQSDLRAIQSALEQSNNDRGYYPYALTLTPGSPLTLGGKTYLNQIPGNPTVIPPYSYRSYGSGCASSDETKCSKYCLFANMETTSTTSPPAFCTPLDSGQNFVVTPP